MKTLADIAAHLQGYDPQAMRASAVASFLQGLVEPVTDNETVDVVAALGRVLADDVISPVSVPPHDNSAMDGFAFAGVQLRPGQPLQLEVVGTALAGQVWTTPVTLGQCVRIMTGAVMPGGLDTVVPQEMATLSGTQLSIAANTLAAGDNRRLLGEDLMRGQAALRAGQRMTPAAMGLLASMGIGRVCVRRRLRVAYFSTGDEILSIGEAAREGAVYDSNRYTVLGMLQQLGCEVIDLGVVRDDPTQLEAAFTSAARQADVVITSGGVSVGEADFTKHMMRQLGDVAFWKIAMRPGRPMAVGRLKVSGVGAILFGLPGNPVAVMVTFLAFVRPALLRMMGSVEPPAPRLLARSTQPIRKKPGRTEYQRAMVRTAADGTLEVQSTGNQGSGVLSSMVQANALMVLAHDQGDIGQGDWVEVQMLYFL
jgi:molybdopterin molybdotransferase